MNFQHDTNVRAPRLNPILPAFGFDAASTAEGAGVAAVTDIADIAEGTGVNDSGTADPYEAEIFQPGQKVSLRPDKIVPSRFANRLDFNWQGDAFMAFKELIKSTGGNLQPILVRPAKRGAKVRYEIAFGHRRHRACLDLNLPVLAVIEEMSDLELVRQMVHENKGRCDCSPYERGLQYKRLLEEKIYPSARQLAQEVGEKDHSLVSRLVKLACLPNEVVGAFCSPADLRVKWGTDIGKALSSDYEGVMTRAREIVANGAPSEPRQVLAKLLSDVPEAPQPLSRTIIIERSGKTVAQIVVPLQAKGAGIEVTFMPGAISANALEEDLRALLTGQRQDAA